MIKKIKIPVLIALLAIIVWSSYQMLRLPLWGHYPLFLFGSIWAFFILAIEQRFSKLPQNRKLLIWATLSGVLLTLGFPVSPLTPLLFIGFIPLLMIEKVIADSRESPSKWEVFKYSYHALVIWNIGTTYWVWNTAFVAGIVAIFLNAFFMTIPIVLFHQTRKVMSRNFFYIAFIVNWLAWEYLHLRWEISWPWLTLGNGFAQYPSWVQWYEYTGVFGGSLWILTANLLIFKIIDKKYFLQKKIPIAAYLKVGSLILLPILVSLFIYYNYEEKGREAEVVVVQPNYEPHYQKFKNRAAQINRYLELSRKTLTEDSEYLVFPETSFGSFERAAIERYPQVRQLQQLVNEYPKLKLVTGILAHHDFDEGERHSAYVKARTSSGKKIYYETYNAAIQLESGQKNAQFYYKTRLVPGAEITPYNKIFFFLKPLIDKLGGTLEGNAQPKEPAVFSSQTSTVAPAICYESVYGEFYTQYIKKGAEAVFVITNDGWWDDTPGHKQHLKFATLRAIETRRDIARSANTGISAFINQRGDILQPTDYEVTTTIRQNIRLNKAITFYVIWGDIIGRLAIFTCLLLLLNTLVKRKIAKFLNML